ncbi:ferric reductase-like transmembrane domain-containing protein [Acetobacter oeni]|uniref:Ferric oxidoreductase domain-containing protein n=1 Tax=Acetobacter oeni TaxID=304077 RepID=A0A511XHX3_9PROT|nr:ferric reductase-like transmembrane domain-containing protein [Acetobacter oeni]MBB3882552.1 hypothetical protein [Acetobacter oeni]NHO18637.1 hypothetical protein [Acetobacter oeni]GBR11933.1 hypothetical protein AA21952_3500 [Acetobacter oeni LMG 21952]GEN62511.1 hypothetical protein AOE01nite_07350 [Acetobacter oeni]
MLLCLPVLCAYSVFLLGFWLARDDLHLSLSWDVAMAAGCGAFFFLLMLFTLTGRPLPLPFFDGKFFLSLHRWIAALFIGCLTFHIGLIIFTDPQTLYDLWPSGAIAMQTGAVAAVLAVVTGGLAFRRVWRRFYATSGIFRISHAMLAVAVLAGSAVHLVGTQVHLVQSWQRELCVGVAVTAALLPSAERWLLARSAVHPGRKRRRDMSPMAAVLAGIMLCMIVSETAAFLFWRR